MIFYFENKRMYILIKSLLYFMYDIYNNFLINKNYFKKLKLYFFKIKIKYKYYFFKIKIKYL